MDSQVEKFDPSKLMDGVKNRIKATFVSLIPDDAWDSMVEKELYIFTTGSITHHREYAGLDGEGHPIYNEWDERKPYTNKPLVDQYGHLTGEGDDISPLQKMIRDMLKEKFRTDLKAYMESEEYQSIWTNYGLPEASNTIEEIVVKNSSTIFQNIIAGMIQAGFDFMKNRLISDNYGNAYRQY